MAFKKKKNYSQDNYQHNKFLVALKGIKTVFLEEISFRCQVAVLVLAIVAGIIVEIDFYSWVIIIIMSTIILSLEILNTAVENIIDMISPEYNIIAGKIKDICAGAVLTSSIGAVIIGLMIFIPKIIVYIERMF